VGIEYAVFHGLTANPKDYEVMAGAAFYAEQHCDLQGLTERQGGDRIANCLLEMRRKVGIEAGLGQRQVHAGDIPELSRHAYHDVCLVTNPRRANQDDLKTIFHEAL
jgi:alcohol dehydrogenase